MDNKEKGQSTIEFVMTFSMTFAFLFLFLKMAMNYTDGYFVHYATYIASRSYLVVDSEELDPAIGDEKALEYAKKVFAKFKLDAFIPGFDGRLSANHPGAKRSVFTGLYTDYTTKFSLGVIGGKEKLEMRSESFLGREPGRFEGYIQTCEAINKVTTFGCDLQATLDDNGG